MQAISKAYVLSSFIGCLSYRQYLKSFVTYLNISENSILLQMISHNDYTDILRDAGANFRRRPALPNTSRKFKLAYCSRALESSDWFLLTHLYSHQSGTLSVKVLLRHRYVISLSLFLRIPQPTPLYLKR